jgi:carotenoid biosynthesis protein
MHLLLSTIALRPYVFVFLAVYLFVSVVNFGFRTTAIFTALTYAMALACEWSSVHNGFPFGLYHYIPATVGREIWVFGVPFMDSLSFTFLSFASYTVALMLASPVQWHGVDLKLYDTRAIRRSPWVWLIAALFMMMVDLALDPLCVLGDRWFLGRIFWYDPPGPHFGVPISNYLGWFFVAALAVALFQFLDARLAAGKRKPLGVIPNLPLRWLLGPGLYLGIVGFAITMLFVVGAPTIAWSATFIFLPFLALIANTLSRPGIRATAADIARHLEDFPYDAEPDAIHRVRTALAHRESSAHLN